MRWQHRSRAARPSRRSPRLADGPDVRPGSRLAAAHEQVMGRTSASIALLTLRRVLRFAVRRGWMTVNPVTLLEPAEKPRWRPQHVDILEGHDLARVLDHAHSFKALFTFLAFTGLPHRRGARAAVAGRRLRSGAGARPPAVHPVPRARAAQDRGGPREVVLAAPVLRLLSETRFDTARKGPDRLRVRQRRRPAARLPQGGPGVPGRGRPGRCPGRRLTFATFPPATGTRACSSARGSTWCSSRASWAMRRRT